MCSLAAAGALAHSLMLLLSALCSRQDTTCIQHFFSFSNLMHVYTYIYVTMQMYCPLTLCLSGDGQGPFHSFTCPTFSLSSQEMLFFFFSIGTFTLYQPSFGIWVLLVLTNKVRLSVTCILAISISCAASHWSWGSLSQCKTV